MLHVLPRFGLPAPVWPRRPPAQARTGCPAHPAAPARPPPMATPQHAAAAGAAAVLPAARGGAAVLPGASSRGLQSRCARRARPGRPGQVGSAAHDALREGGGGGGAVGPCLSRNVPLRWMQQGGVCWGVRRGHMVAWWMQQRGVCRGMLLWACASAVVDAAGWGDAQRRLRQMWPLPAARAGGSSRGASAASGPCFLADITLHRNPHCLSMALPPDHAPSAPASSQTPPVTPTSQPLPHPPTPTLQPFSRADLPRLCKQLKALRSPRASPFSFWLLRRCAAGGGAAGLTLAQRQAQRAEDEDLLSARIEALFAARQEQVRTRLAPGQGTPIAVPCRQHPPRRGCARAGLRTSPPAFLAPQGLGARTPVPPEFCPGQLFDRPQHASGPEHAKQASRRRFLAPPRR